MTGHGNQTPPPAEPANRPGTLRRRLLATGLGALVLGLLLLGIGVHGLLAHGLVEQHRAATEAEAAAVGRALEAAAPARWREVFAAAAERPHVDRVDLLAGGDLLLAVPEASDRAEGTEQRNFTAGHGALTVLLAAAFEPPVATVRVPVALAAPAGTAEVRVTARSVDHAASLTRLDLTLGVLILAAFVLVSPVVVALVIRQTAPLAALHDAVALAHRAGRVGVPGPVPVRRGSSELVQLCRAIDSLGVDVAEARSRLSRANEDLSKQVKARTAELSQLNGQLEADAEDKDHFLRAVSHDLSAPLRNIDGLTTLLLGKHAEELSEGAASRLERIRINVRHQTELISDLLELSRLRTRAHRPVELRLGELVDEVAGGLSFDLEHAGIAFEMTGSWPVIFAERNRLRQVFQNLIDNAIKYMMDSEERRITAAVSRERDFEADIFDGVDVYRFCVTDTGRGIAEEDLPSVFRVFARSIHSGTHEVAGRGVGLACVETIVRRYGGRVGVDSRLGEGSSFWFTLPVASVSAPADSEAAVAATAPPGEATIGRAA